MQKIFLFNIKGLSLLLSKILLLWNPFSKIPSYATCLPLHWVLSSLSTRSSAPILSSCLSERHWLFPPYCNHRVFLLQKQGNTHARVCSGRKYRGSCHRRMDVTATDIFQCCYPDSLIDSLWESTWFFRLPCASL